MNANCTISRLHANYVFQHKFDFLVLLQNSQFGSVKWAVCEITQKVAGPNSKLRTPLKKPEANL